MDGFTFDIPTGAQRSTVGDFGTFVKLRAAAIDKAVDTKTSH